MAEHGSVGRIRFQLRQLLRKLWVRVSCFAALGLGTAIAGWALRGAIPDDLAGWIGADAIGTILQIIASSMLTVTTFSLSILTAAYATASSGTTPRSVRLIAQDGVSQTVLATFIGAFVFSLVGLIMLQTKLYGEGGRVILFLVTLIVILVVIVSLLRWIDRLATLGLVGDTVTRVEEATANALERRLKSPWMGANPLRGAPPPEAAALHPDRVGHVQNCDMQALSDLAGEHDLRIYLAAIPGDLAHPAQPVCHVVGRIDDAVAGDLRDCFTLAAERSFDQDPGFGFRVLSEVAQRALSPAVNDPGTAEVVLTRMLRILSPWTGQVRPDVSFPRLYSPGLDPAALLGDSLRPIMRDGAGVAQVHLAIQRMLHMLLLQNPEVFAGPVRDLAAESLLLADAHVALDSEKARIRALSDQMMHDLDLVVVTG
ncbi:DUF2254 domain-containing protein [Paracoccus zeaxanthinifaciens]|uniref:DUF2254 domain-containing protein n=1 Tax=Paracoccus zeaxanthinifaciens TaxID=187400 RepID=UPI0003B4716B|nr:DUF2254 domain-containing protein [Paracoccus zeaxanthinifaciens]